MHDVDVSELKGPFAEKRAVISIVGLGYVGLPWMQAALRMGFKTSASDIDDPKLESVIGERVAAAQLPAQPSRCHDLSTLFQFLAIGLSAKSSADTNANVR